MKKKEWFIVLLCLLIAPPLICGQTMSELRLRLLTINVWSGLDYQGFFRFGEYESSKRRKERFTALVKQVKELDPDVVFVQEANFAGPYARRLASMLGFTEIHQVANGGIKFGPLGIPVNFKEGMAILAKPALRLRRHDVWKLSGPLGLYGDFMTLNFKEAVHSLAVKIIINDTPFYLVNVHLNASPPYDEGLLGKLRERPDGQEMSSEQFERALAVTKERNQRRRREIQRLLQGLKSLPEGAPVIIAGDFNAEMNSPELQMFISSAGVLDVLTAAQDRDVAGSRENRFTWDPGLNENIVYSSRPKNASGRKLKGYDLLNALNAATPRRIDFIFLNKEFRPENVLASSLAVQSKEFGLHASDHFGVFAEVDLESICQRPPHKPQTVGRQAARPSFS